MAHEMMHAYDHLRFKLDWTDNLRHAACTEVCLSFLSSFLFQYNCIYPNRSLVCMLLDPCEFVKRRM